MLRSGYTSQTILKELETRHFVDAVDAETETSLVKAGATPDLITALKNGSYSVSPEVAAQVKAKLDAQAQEREALAEQAKSNSARYQEQLAKDRESGMNNFRGGNSTYDYLKGSLVKVNPNGMVRVDDEVIGRKKLIAYYFSAHWCQPCRKFTPKLVEYYNQIIQQHPEFEVVFYSQDKSAADMESYMREANMPWPAIAFDKRADKREILQAAGAGIPSLVVVESTGRLVSASFNGDKYLGPEKVLADIDSFFSGTFAQAH